MDVTYFDIITLEPGDTQHELWLCKRTGNRNDFVEERARIGKLWWLGEANEGWHLRLDDGYMLPVSLFRRLQIAVWWWKRTSPFAQMNVRQG